MIYFSLRVAVYSVAAAVVMHLVPGLRLVPVPGLPEPAATIIAYILVGLIFGTLHSFIRPLILFLAGRLYIASMGLMALAIDVFIFMLVSYLAPAVWMVGVTRLFSSILGAVLMGVIVLALDALLGFDAPRAAEVRKTPFYWRWLGMLPTGRRNRIIESLRIQQMIGIIESYVIEITISLSPLRGFRRAMKRLIYRRRTRLTEEDPAVMLRLMLQELGPTFVKFGQMAASRIEILPLAWQSELARLQDDVRPFPYTEVEETIQRTWGKTPTEVFATFNQQPLAAASTAQVHAATLPAGENVVVKVRRPNIDVTVKGDLNVMHDVIDMAERRVPGFRQFGLSALFEEFATNLLTELDYTNEAYHARRLQHNMQPFEFVQVPTIYSALSASSILTMQRVEGMKISDVAALDAAGVDREALALQFFKALLQQLLFDGFFHADPHPGNVWVHLQSKRIIFLDMGMMGRLSRTDRLLFGELIWALQDHDAHATTQVLMDICKPAPRIDAALLEREVERLIYQHLVFEASSAGITQIIGDLVGSLLRFNLQLRSEFTLAFKAMGQGESIMRILMGDKPPDYIINVAFNTLKEMLLAQLQSQQMVGVMGKSLVHEAVHRLPALVNATAALLDDFQHGQSAVQISAGSIDQQVKTLQAGLAQDIRRVVLSVSLAGLLLGCTLILLVPNWQSIHDIYGLIIRDAAIVGFAISAPVLLVLMLSTLWQTLSRRVRP